MTKPPVCPKCGGTVYYETFGDTGDGGTGWTSNMECVECGRPMDMPGEDASQMPTQTAQAVMPRTDHQGRYARSGSRNDTRRRVKK